MKAQAVTDLKDHIAKVRKLHKDTKGDKVVGQELESLEDRIHSITLKEDDIGKIQRRDLKIMVHISQKLREMERRISKAESGHRLLQESNKRKVEAVSKAVTDIKKRLLRYAESRGAGAVHRLITKDSPKREKVKKKGKR